jgi:hypothetical protein
LNTEQRIVSNEEISRMFSLTTTTLKRRVCAVIIIK